MGILPARCDIEVDSAMELIKTYDVKGERTIGILTKIDLMNTNTDIGDYLTNNIRTRIIKVPSKYWEPALFLPTDTFKKKGRSTVWRESRKMLSS